MDDKMEELEKFEFDVGERYTNERGVFEVLSIERKSNEMVIRWEDGQEIKSDIELQLRIQKRRRREKMVQEREAESGSAKTGRTLTGKRAKPFEGLQSEDFRNKISRTNWRSRGQLGGTVTAQLPSDRFSFNSWAARGRNEIHWADAVNWKNERISHPAKFFACADETSFAWGFYIERPTSNDNGSADWDAFIKWLRNEENDQWLRGVALEEDLKVYDAHQSCASDVISPREADWGVEGVDTSTDTLGAAIDSWPENARLDLMIAKRIPKEDAIARKKAIAENIANLFSRLLLVYAAAVAHMN
jgi:hypothetical protein